jgi:hypothetical protein
VDGFTSPEECHHVWSLSLAVVVFAPRGRKVAPEMGRDRAKTPTRKPEVSHIFVFQQTEPGE